MNSSVLLAKRHLAKVTLVAVATTEVEAASKALEYSTRSLGFERVLLISDCRPDQLNSDHEQIQIPPFKSVGEWGKFIVFDLHKYIHTEFIILVHPDGFIVNPEQWDDQFLNYDYIGAPWPIPSDNFSYRDYFGNIIRVGNSVSLRSRKLLALPSTLKLDWDTADHGFFHEDGFICVQNRHILQSKGIEFAPLSIACRFSREKTLPENKDVEPFAFHKWQGRNRNYPRFSANSALYYQLNKTIKFFFR